MKEYEEKREFLSLSRIGKEIDQYGELTNLHSEDPAACPRLSPTMKFGPLTGLYHTPGMLPIMSILLVLPGPWYGTRTIPTFY